MQYVTLLDRVIAAPDCISFSGLRQKQNGRRDLEISHDTFFNWAKVHMQMKEGRKAVGKKHATLF